MPAQSKPSVEQFRFGTLLVKGGKEFIKPHFHSAALSLVNYLFILSNLSKPGRNIDTCSSIGALSLKGGLA